jgi:hypothetical protein
MAIQTVGQANNEELTHTLIEFLMGEPDGVPKVELVDRPHMLLASARLSSAACLISQALPPLRPLPWLLSHFLGLFACFQCSFFTLRARPSAAINEFKDLLVVLNASPVSFLLALACSPSFAAARGCAVYNCH